MRVPLRPIGLLASALIVTCTASVSGQSADNPILYVNQVPVTATDNTVVSIGGSHLADTKAAPRGGGLMIRYPNGRVLDLTKEAGFGVSETLQTGNAIAVRDPVVHWSGEKALFSMVVGAPLYRGDSRVFYWQLYEVSNLGQGENPVITKVPGQPINYNNIQPTYTSDDRIIFASDKSITENPYLYPARNEQGGESVTGLWSLDPEMRTVKLLDHSPSGSFKPFIDSYGRVVFSRWDHLQRDTEAVSLRAVDYLSEDQSAATAGTWYDVFPEALQDNPKGPGHTFDLFLPWTMNQDGTGLLTMNHLGRHELGTAFTKSSRDSNLVDFVPESPPISSVGAPTRAGSYLHLAESRQSPGTYVATDALSNAVSAGRLVTFGSAPTRNADSVQVTVASNQGFARDPYFLENGNLVASVASGPPLFGSYGGSRGVPGLPPRPLPPFAEIPPEFIPPTSTPFQIRMVVGSMDLRRGMPMAPSTHVTRTNYVDGKPVTFRGDLWQLQPVEVVSRPIPGMTTEPLPDPELKMFQEAGVSPSAFKRWLSQNDLALVVSRNVTARDRNDKQQPFNLRVPGGVFSIADGGDSYNITNLQFFQGDYVRAYQRSEEGESASGRRVAARVMHEDRGENLPSNVPGSAKIQRDGSTAMFLPAGRAVTWQLTDQHGEAVVRERYWLTFQAGEIRSCTNCHGNNTADQLNRKTVQNPPSALRRLLQDWSSRHPEAGATVTPYEFWAEFNLSPGAPATGDANGDGMSNMEAYAYGFGANGHAAKSSLAKALTPAVLTENGEEYTKLQFTLNTEADRLRVVVESSTDLQNWLQAATIENTEPVHNDGSVRVSATTTGSLSARKLKLLTVRGVNALKNRPDVYYRLRFEEMPPPVEN